MEKSSGDLMMMNLKATELRLGLPGVDDPDDEILFRCNKRALPEISQESESNSNSSVCYNSGGNNCQDSAPPAKAQVVGWPPIRSYRKNTLQSMKNESDKNGGRYVKVSVDGAPYLRKIDIKVYNCYSDLLNALQTMFKLTIGKQFHPYISIPTYSKFSYV